MNEPTLSVADYQQAAERHIDQLPLGDGLWLTDKRRVAAHRFRELGFPNARQEDWRYTSIKRLLEKGFVADDAQSSFTPHSVKSQFLSEPVAGRLVFVDGLFQRELSDTDQEGVQLSSLNSVMAAGDKAALKALGSLSGIGEQGFAALNMATMQDGAIIRIAAGVKLEQPIELLHLTSRAAAGLSLRPRHLIILEEDASATLVERYLSLDDDEHFTNLVCEIVLGEGSNLHHQRVEQENPQAYHLSELYLGLQAQAEYRLVTASLGAGWSRTKINSRFSAPGANCELDGLYLAGDGQLVDYHLNIDHAVPGCSSRENFKGILTGQGRAVFDGRILVREQAQKSDAHLSNANLMLSRHAEIDTKPQLEILADDVQCSHGTTVGQLDAEAIFYLRSRGLNMEQARRLLCLGFASEILERFESDSLREQLGEVIRQRLETSAHA
ncbi:Fe-S cluster assembly protein SufD [bacterium endosymbiont of Escarpia laminata]|nr:MAG: Fe-S cluster assembly protein SufD [bacterium endosymbiont of Escarpia laminata]